MTAAEYTRLREQEEWLYDKLEDLRGQEERLPARSRSRIRRQIDRYDEALTRLHQTIHPVYIPGVPFPRTPDQCPDCGAYVDENARFKRTGRCVPCFQIATGQRPRPVEQSPYPIHYNER